MSGKLILARNGDFVNHSFAPVSHNQIPARQAGKVSRLGDDQAWVVCPQINRFLSDYGESLRRMIGSDFDLQVTIADNLSTLPYDCILLLIDILDECIGYFGWRENGSSLAQIRVSEVRHNRNFSLLLLEVKNRHPKGLFAQEPNKGLLQLRTRAEFWSGFIRIDSVSHEETTIRAILPIVSKHSL